MGENSASEIGDSVNGAKTLFVASWPYLRTEKRITLDIDFAETFVEVAGATPDPGVEGTSLVPLLGAEAYYWPGSRSTPSIFHPGAARSPT